jgi:hypothetical protein
MTNAGRVEPRSVPEELGDGTELLDVGVDLSNVAREAAVERTDLVPELFGTGGPGICSFGVPRLPPDPLLGPANAEQRPMQDSVPERAGHEGFLEFRETGLCEPSRLQAKVPDHGRRTADDLELRPKAVPLRLRVSVRRGQGGTVERGVQDSHRRRFAADGTSRTARSFAGLRHEELRGARRDRLA